MKHITLLLFSFLVLLFTNLTFGQELNWYEYKLDHISIDFPSEDIFLMDTVISQLKIKQIYTTYENTSLLLQKLPIEGKLPYDYNSLIQYYLGVSEGMTNDSKKEKFVNSEIKHDGFIGYKTIIYDANGKPFNESNTFLIDSNLITITYYNFEPFDNKTKNQFFNSLKFGELSSSKQYSGESLAYRQGKLFGELMFYVVLLVAVFIFLWYLFKKKQTIS